MYEDAEVWPIHCAKCGNWYVEKIGRLAATRQSRCACGEPLRYEDEQIVDMLAAAKVGSHDPWKEAGIVRKPD